MGLLVAEEVALLGWLGHRMMRMTKVVLDLIWCADEAL